MDTRTQNTIIKELIAPTQIHCFFVCCYLLAFWIRLADTNLRWTDSLLVNQVGWVFGWDCLLDVKTIYHLKQSLYMIIFNAPLMYLIPNKKEDFAAYRNLPSFFFSWMGGLLRETDNPFTWRSLVETGGRKFFQLIRVGGLQPEGPDLRSNYQRRG